jgi:hypothetical protein
MTARPNIARLNIARTHRDGRSMCSKSAQREASLAHVPPAQQRVGQLSKQQKRGAGGIKESFGADADDRPHPAALEPAFRRFSWSLR